MRTQEAEKKDLRHKKTLTNQQISAICNELFLRLPSLLHYFDIDFVEYPNRLAFACPVHGGDNPEACCIFTDGMTQKGNWSCWTQHCEDDYTSNLFGFVRGCLSNKRDKSISMNEAAAFCSNFLEKNIDELDLEPNQTNTFRVVDIFNKTVHRQESTINRGEIRSKINIPSEYYMGRGYSAETLDVFDVGECLAENQPMSGRVVVPIYDEGYNYIGCVGRSKNENMKPKWLHSKGFRKSVLYGLNIAKEEILSTSCVVLVEGQGDVWRLHEAGIKNAVGIFGSSINDDQLILLESSGALDVIVLTDTDEAGSKAYNQIVKKCGRRFNYHRPVISHKDVGDMSTEEIKKELYPQIKGIINE